MSNRPQIAAVNAITLIPRTITLICACQQFPFKTLYGIELFLTSLLIHDSDIRKALKEESRYNLNEAYEALILPFTFFSNECESITNDFLGKNDFLGNYQHTYATGNHNFNPNLVPKASEQLNKSRKSIWDTCILTIHEILKSTIAITDNIVSLPFNLAKSVIGIGISIIYVLLSIPNFIIDGARYLTYDHQDFESAGKYLFERGVKSFIFYTKSLFTNPYNLLVNTITHCYNGVTAPFVGLYNVSSILLSSMLAEGITNFIKPSNKASQEQKHTSDNDPNTNKKLDTKEEIKSQTTTWAQRTLENPGKMHNTLDFPS